MWLETGPSFSDAIYLLTNMCIGLYEKLHGSPRPVNMKKQEIKRRKRVVPAGNEQRAPGYSPQPSNLPTPQFEHDVSPDPNTAIESRETNGGPSGLRAPIAVDYTHYKASTQGPLTPASTLGEAPSPRSPRKRSISSTSDPEESAPKVVVTTIPHRSHDIHSLLNPTRPTDDNIDPALSNIGARPRVSPVPQEERIARKEKLRREAEAMREELARKERELMEMDD